MKFARLWVLAAALIAAPSLVTATSHDAPGQLTDGEVRKVDRDSGKITIKHGAIVNLGMPPMTMVFQLKDSSLLGQFKTGDRVHFAAEKVGGQYTIVRIEPAN